MTAKKSPYLLINELDVLEEIDLFNYKDDDLNIKGGFYNEE